MTYLEKAAHMQNAAGKALLQRMEEKETNLCVAADEIRAGDILALADRVGPHICLLKTHCDIIEDFTDDFIHALQALAEKHRFFLFEDRKFADIGNTVQLQYTKGVFRIVEWADFVNAHTLLGPGIIKGLKEAAAENAAPRGLILLAQVTPEGNLVTDQYMEQTVTMAESSPDFVAGFIANGGDVAELTKLASRAAGKFILLAPGVKLGGGGDRLGQRYTTPEDVIQAGADIIIVGRGVTGEPDQALAAEAYRAAGWKAYQSTKTS